MAWLLQLQVLPLTLYLNCPSLVHPCQSSLSSLGFESLTGETLVGCPPLLPVHSGLCPKPPGLGRRTSQRCPLGQNWSILVQLPVMPVRVEAACVLRVWIFGFVFFIFLFFYFCFFYFFYDGGVCPGVGFLHPAWTEG